ncbi:transmembrane protein EpsG [Chryseobacterium ginsenosidimutans]|uniref:EpsG family protein n=1 Tax=Chryseobacterium ginsenosidimutans TaxID=687846 RepID=UPI002167B5D6|nr:EpsG family protein [Chryseobacterium ginsenosidimutans]MCS3867103.1 transmembrane protein EpsG [Chryseobacterium ginsenosidimutans]
MSLLHPYYIIAIIYMMIFSYQEVFNGKVEKKWLWALGVYLIIIAGLRDEVGPDYGSYRGIYVYSDTKEYITIIMKAFGMNGPQPMEVEWLYVFINKLLLNIFNAPFYILTFVIAILAIYFKVEYTDDNTFYPFTFMLFLFIPGFFIGENGQIRQNLGSFIAYFGIRFIKERKLWAYLICIYLAAGVHTVCYIFLPMYWLVRIPLNKYVMLSLIIISVFLSPFEVYRVFGDLLTSISADNTVAVGFNGYVDESVERLNGAIGIPEVMMAILTFFLFTFDTKMKEKFPYYEYHRAYVVIGICFYFIFRSNPIFSSRLAGAFIGFAYIIIPNAMYVVSANSKRMIYSFIIALTIFNFVVFSSFKNIIGGRFTAELYKNHILP